MTEKLRQLGVTRSPAAARGWGRKIIKKKHKRRATALDESLLSFKGHLAGAVC